MERFDGKFLFSEEDIVQTFFKGLLKRPASTNDVNYFSNIIKNISSEEGIFDLINSIANSVEARSKNGLISKSDLSQENLSKEFSRYRSVISFGTHCYTGKLLQSFGLKQFSTPFDWIFSNAGMIAHALDDDFHIFLDKNYHISRDDNPEASRADHTYYKSNYCIDSLFNHRDPNVDGNFAYYERAVARLQRLRYSNDRVLCVMVSQIWHTSYADFERLSESVRNYSNNFDIMCVLVNENKSVFGFKEHVNSERATLIEYHSLGTLGPLDFDTQIDNIILGRILYKKYFGG